MAVCPVSSVIKDVVAPVSLCYSTTARLTTKYAKDPFSPRESDWAAGYR